MSSAERTLHVTRTTSTAHRLLHYDGACGNVHGHNLDWEVEVALSMADAGEANMPVDLKDIADTLDRLDHATCLNADDTLTEAPLGQVVTFDGDPTCEHLSQRMAEWVHDLAPAIRYVAVTVHETGKYGVSATYAGE
jgi:6-pyruvoyl-tetrahydropterin synthase